MCYRGRPRSRHVVSRRQHALSPRQVARSKSRNFWPNNQKGFWQVRQGWKWHHWFRGASITFCRSWSTLERWATSGCTQRSRSQWRWRYRSERIRQMVLHRHESLQRCHQKHASNEKPNINYFWCVGQRRYLKNHQGWQIYDEAPNQDPVQRATRVVLRRVNVSSPWSIHWENERVVCWIRKGNWFERICWNQICQSLCHNVCCYETRPKGEVLDILWKIDAVV